MGKDRRSPLEKTLRMVIEKDTVQAWTHSFGWSKPLDEQHEEEDKESQ